MADTPPVSVESAHQMWATVVRDGQEDYVAVEEPLEIRVDGAPLAVTMRTPGHDEELAVGFLYTEGLIDGPRNAGPTADFAVNTIEVEGPLGRDPGSRRFYTTSSCGVCGKGALEEVAVHAEQATRAPSSIATCWRRCPTSCASRPSSAPAGCTPPGCSRRRGAAARPRGRWPSQRDGQGRRARVLDGIAPLHGRVLCVSGRLSFELVQKAAVAGAPVLVGVGAPSSLAVSLAADRGMTLAGFARRGQVNVYTGAERVRG